MECAVFCACTSWNVGEDVELWVWFSVCTALCEHTARCLGRSWFKMEEIFRRTIMH